MFVSEVIEENLTDELIERILYNGINDTGEKGDCILVLGSIKATKYRVPVAAKLYEAERANKIMLCGGATRNFPAHITIIPCPADDTTTRANRSNSLEGIKRAKGEVFNIVRCVKNGVIPDFEV